MKFSKHRRPPPSSTADSNPHVSKVREYAQTHIACETVVISAQIESDLIDLSPEEAKEFLQSVLVQGDPRWATRDRAANPARSVWKTATQWRRTSVPVPSSRSRSRTAKSTKRSSWRPPDPRQGKVPSQDYGFQGCCECHLSLSFAMSHLGTRHQRKIGLKNSCRGTQNNSIALRRQCGCERPGRSPLA